MTPLSQEFVDSCPRQDDFRIRGMEMTRIPPSRVSVESENHKF